MPRGLQIAREVAERFKCYLQVAAAPYFTALVDIFITSHQVGLMIHLDGLDEPVLRIKAITALQERNPDISVGVADSGVQPDRLTVRVSCLTQTARVQQGAPEGDMQGGFPRVEVNRPAVCFDGLAGTP